MSGFFCGVWRETVPETTLLRERPAPPSLPPPPVRRVEAPASCDQHEQQPWGGAGRQSSPTPANTTFLPPAGGAGLVSEVLLNVYYPSKLGRSQTEGCWWRSGGWRPSSASSFINLFNS